MLGLSPSIMLSDPPMAENKNMLENIKQKYVFWGTLGLIVILAAVTLSNPVNFLYKDQTNYDLLRQQAEDQQQQYQKLLDSVQPDYAASRQFLKKIATEDLVSQEVKQALDPSQKIVVPDIPDSQLKILPRGTALDAKKYFIDLAANLSSYSNSLKTASATVFSQDQKPGDAAHAAQITNNLVVKLKQAPVTKDAVAFHKAQIQAFQNYSDVFQIAEDNSLAADDPAWKKIYKDYAIINSQVDLLNTEFLKLSSKYKLSELVVPMAGGQEASSFFAKSAQAQLSTVTVEDLPARIREAIKIGLARAFAKFSIQMLDKVVAQIQKNFTIASQLYYSQELGRYYSIEYLKKFVQDPLDQKVIENFLPEYFCIPKNKDELKQIFTAKAKQYLAGQGAAVLDVNDPTFWQKLDVYGAPEVANSETWYNSYYDELANHTQALADAAASKEVLSPGVKTGRSILQNQIDKTAASIFGVQQAAIEGTINLGINNTENVVSQIVAGVIENLVNKYVFTAIGSGQGGSIGVLQEQNVCLRTPKINPIVPLGQTTYETPPAPTNTPIR